MSISRVSGPSAAQAVHSEPVKQQGKSAQAPVQRRQDTVELSPAAKAQLQGADADGDHDGK